MSASILHIVTALAIVLAGLLTRPELQPANNPANPYRTVGAWGTMPPGRTC